MKYVVTKKCYANEFVFVDADSAEEAIDKASKDEVYKTTSTLEWSGYLPHDTWLTEELQPNGLVYEE